MDDDAYAARDADPDLTRLDDDEVYDEAIGLLAAVTDALLDDVRALDDEAVAGASLLPGWTRGHVLAHVARNADACRNLLTWAATGTRTPMYPSAADRDAAIEAGAARSAAEHEADVESSAEHVLADLAALPADRRHVEVGATRGVTLPAHDIVWWRIREVAYHHVDLDVGHGFADLPGAVLDRGLTESVARFERFGGAPDLGLVATDAPWTGRLGVGGEPVRGSRVDLLGWLTGRTVGAGLQGPDPLPDLPSWG